MMRLCTLVVFASLWLNVLVGSVVAQDCKRYGRYCQKTSECCGALECIRDICQPRTTRKPTEAPRTRKPTFRPTRSRPTRRPTFKPTKDCLGVGAVCKESDDCCTKRCIGNPRATCRKAELDCKRSGRSCQKDDDCCGSLFCSKQKLCTLKRSNAPTLAPVTSRPTNKPTRKAPTRRPTTKPTKDCLGVGAFCKVNAQCCSDRCFGTPLICRRPK